MMLPTQAHLLLVFTLTGHLWRIMGSPLVMDPNSICRRSKPAGGAYSELCQTQPEIIQEVAKGARLGIRECQHQFHHQRWNCTGHGKSLGKILQQDIRETAFVNGITAAGVLYAVTRACSQGELIHCGCVAIKSSSGSSNEQAMENPNPVLQDQHWQWGGCGDDVDYGYKISRQFMDTRKQKGKSDIKSLIDLHNNEAGRLAVKTNMRPECKCHGLSGSCTLRSCWRKLPLFRQVGNHLMQSFQTAVRVMGGNDGKSLVPLDRDVPHLGAHNLIYSDESPDFCMANRRTGSEGTQGRMDPLCMILGLPDGRISKHRRLFNILTFAARKNILLFWIKNVAPTTKKKSWHNIVMDCIPSEYITCMLHSKIDAFYKVWDPYL
ncbi:protein Wnt-6 isoform X3 [Neoarius graeffei]|uniref:protein Wnt-6 isoform X3 n=1 Tax=Neoarius graeffei TaxID=443677 RepID=UPI00298C29FC|nr:protein Wnt-6 isoform X3 [Neoarius graeffei]